MRVFILMSKCFYGFFFFRAHLRFIIFAGLLQNMLDFRDCYDREEFREKEIEGKKQTEGSHVKANLPDRWSIISTPAAGNIFPVNRGYDDHETFKPHSDIYYYRHEEGNH